MRTSRSIHSSFTVILLTAALVLGTLPASAADPIDRFVDDDRSVHEGSIDAIAQIGLTTGCNPPVGDRYCPDRQLTRGELATMLVRVTGLSTSDTGRFVDVSGSAHRNSIEALAAAGITNGCNPPADDRFCPDRTVTRGEFAALLARSLELEGGSKEFRDASSHIFSSEIAALAANGVTRGCNPPDNDRFCPDRRVTRGEVATFMARALGLEVIPNTDNDDSGSGGGGEGDPGMPPPPADPPPEGTAAYPGQPASGTVLWGASVDYNDDPRPRHEIPTGENLSLRRTFFQWNHRTGYMIDVARADINNDRLPWVSIKTPTWTEMASGARDAEIDAMLRGLDGLPGAVWLTVHHEPDGGGPSDGADQASGPQGHLAMNRRVRQRMTALGVDNVALAPILISWSWSSQSGRNPDQWWDSGVYDFLGVDHYACYSGAASCQGESLLNPLWSQIRSWAAEKGVDVAVGEWGLRGSDASAGQRVSQWFDSAVRSGSDGGGARVVGLAAYDADPHNTVSYRLRGEQLEVFHARMKDPRVADPPH